MFSNERDRLHDDDDIYILIRESSNCNHETQTLFDIMYI